MIRRAGDAGACARLALAACAALLAGAPARAAAVAPTSEYWDLYARFDSGERIFARLMLTDEGPGERNAVTTGSLLRADGGVVPLLKGKRGGDWQRSDDGLRLRIGKSVLERSGPEHRFAFGSTKYGVDLELRFTPAGLAAGSGSATAGYASEVLEMGAPVEGWYRLSNLREPRALRGTLALTHTRSWGPESERALRRIEFLSLGEGAALYLSDLTAPDGRRGRWLAARRDGRILYRSENFELELGAESPAVADPAYPFPAAFRIRNGELEGVVRLTNVLARQDLLDGLPLPIRMLLSFRMRPHRVWAESPYEVELRAAPDAPPSEFRGTGVTSITFLNPL